MDEEECNYRSPIGQIIKRMTTMSKKPKFDDELGKALDTFRQTLANQQKYLNNGIFQTNFAEAALFLQSSADVYGKRVDLLWNEILEFHTRLIEYDCEHAKQKGLKMNEDDIKRLEERRNRYKRKKTFKLLPAQFDHRQSFLYDEHITTDDKVPFEFDDKIYQAWKNVEYESNKITKIPYIVYKQKLKTYRMKNYPLWPGADFIIEDLEDGEFNTRYSRLPSWHVIYHLFEYNDEGLMPDGEDKCIAKLRLCMYRRLQFMYERNIPYNTPYYQYKEEYLAFRQKFFEEEAKKWQNMPLNTLEDLGRQYEYLAKMAQEQEKNNIDLHRITPVPKLIHKDEIIYCSDESNDEDKNSQALDKVLEGSDDGLFELSFDCTDISKTDLFVRLEKLSSDVINSKLRQDSGFFDFDDDMEEEGLSADVSKDNSETVENNAVVTEKSDTNNSETQENNNCENTITADNPSTMNSTNENISNNENNENSSNESNKNTTIENNENNTNENNTNENNGNNTNENIGNITNENNRNITNENDENNTNENNGNITNENNGNITNENNGNITNDNSEKNTNVNNENQILMDVDNFDTRSILSDHDYCSTPLPLSEHNMNHNKSSNIKKLSTIPENEPLPIKAGKMLLVKNKQFVDKENQQPGLLHKRRKLSRKQIEKLAKSLVPPTKIMKFERFFSLNYQPQLGEGEVEPVEYESDDPDIDEACENLLNEPTENNHILDNDDCRSIRSEHSYCRLPEESAKEANNDSEIADLADFFDKEEFAELLRISKLPEFNQATTKSTSHVTPYNSYEECQRRLADIRKQIEDNEDDSNDPAYRNKWKDEIERLELKIRVEEWKQTITPILKNLEERDFDIHEYGSQIMDGMRVNETVPFGRLVDGKSSAEVVRYFTSSLQLANTNNIEVCGVKPGELSNDTYSIKLLTRDRYHEHLTEYEAPSKETFRERLKRMRNKNEEQDSDSEDEPLAKIAKSDKKQSQVQIKSNSGPKQNPVKQKNILTPPMDIDTNQVTKNKDAKANPLKGKAIIKVPVQQRLLAVNEGPSTSQQIWSESLRDSGFMSESINSVDSFDQESEIEQSSTLLTPPSEECFRGTLIQRQHQGRSSQSTPVSSASFKYLSVTIPRSLHFQ